MRTLFEQFISEKRYLSNLSETTIRSYTLAFKWFEPYGFERLDDFVIAMRQKGLSAGGCNVKIRSINSFLSWCHSKGHCNRIKIKALKHRPQVPYQLTEAQIRSLVMYRPKNEIETRIHALTLLCLDTGIRVEEGLTLTKEKLDFDNLLLTVIGKGNKERVIPFSMQMRKTLFKLCKSNNFDLVFCTRHGLKLNYHNARRDLQSLAGKLGIKCGFHDFRRFFITNAIKNGVNPLIVQRIAGHSSFSVTQRYIYLLTEDLSHAHTSAVARYR